MGVGERLERHQIPVHLGGLGVGVLLGLTVPTTAEGFGAAVTPLLAVLIYATFLQVPWRRAAVGLADTRFLLVLLGLNFVVVPVVVLALTATVDLEDAVLLGVLLTLLTPCVDYVVVFTGVAGGDRERLIVATPVLLVAQAVLLPWFLSTRGWSGIVSAEPFLEALIGLLLAPLLLAVLTQALARRARPARRLSAAAEAGMVPALALVLLTVAASQVPRVRGDLGDVLPALPVFVGFLAVMAALGTVVGRLLLPEHTGRRALLFSGCTRNSLVVLPLALALPAGYDLTAAVVVTQTMVELLGLVVLLALAPRLMPAT